jgi:hypothetical protein
MLRSGRLLASLALVATSGCGVKYSFNGSNAFSDVKTMAVRMFDNKTTSPDLQQEIFEAMRNDLRKRLGLREASEDAADAVVSGVIQEYQADMAVGMSADPTRVSTRRRLAIRVDIQIVGPNKAVLFERRGMIASADYADRGEVDARRKAIANLMNDIVTGAQTY